MKPSKPIISKAKLYNFWMARWTMGRIELVASGPTPTAAYEALFTDPTAFNKSGAWLK